MERWREQVWELVWTWQVRGDLSDEVCLSQDLQEKKPGLSKMNRG